MLEYISIFFGLQVYISIFFGLQVCSVSAKCEIFPFIFDDRLE